MASVKTVNQVSGMEMLFPSIVGLSVRRMDPKGDPVPSSPYIQGNWRRFVLVKATLYRNQN